MTTSPNTAADRHLDPDAVEVGALVHSAMWRRRLTLGELGRVMGVSQSTASKKVRGLVPITTSELMRIGRALDVDPADLLPRLDSNQQPSGYRYRLASGVIDLTRYRLRAAG